jgi:hypothetical protein
LSGLARLFKRFAAAGNGSFLAPDSGVFWRFSLEAAISRASPGARPGGGASSFPAAAKKPLS